jgi:hypothetical protein
MWQATEKSRAIAIGDSIATRFKNYSLIYVDIANDIVADKLITFGLRHGFRGVFIAGTIGFMHVANAIMQN